MSQLSLEQARRLWGDDLIAPEDLVALLGVVPRPAASGPLPFSSEEAAAAHAAGSVLVYRPAQTPDGAALNLAWLHERARSGALLGGAGFRGESPRFVSDLTVCSEVVEPGWALVARSPWPETLNRTFDQGSRALAERAAGLAWRRRRAVEIAFDCFAFATARGVRLLARAWDWSSTGTSDGGLVNVGGFDEKGLEVLSYSRAVKHGELGVCPTLVRG